ncbi:MAG: TlyA family RNA methyltransferase [Actinomycetota bacterium]|nr:TlyA family RNA methyltransferase [Actinomycetota bacterium]
MAQRVRLDNLLVKQARFKSRESAKEAIISGRIFVDGFPCDKPARLVSLDSDISIIDDKPESFVSRGGTKLKEALDRFDIDPTGKVALDAGISTGGFTDCLLKEGARLVIGVDVGYGQLDWALRNDPRLQLFERTNIKDLSPDLLVESADIVLADLSFISITKVFKSLKSLAKEDADFIILIKPQFEVGKKDVGKGGIIRDPLLHERVLKDLHRFFAFEGARVLEIIGSPIKGSKGNKEFFFHISFKREGPAPLELDQKIDELVFDE